jgi:predicted TIM-barrel fold metal-dependent hydrolase
MKVTAGELPDFADGLVGVPDSLIDGLSLPLVDHHVHACFSGPTSRAMFEQSLNEGSPDPIPEFLTMFDSQLGFAIRRWCAPLLGLAAHADADTYWRARSLLGAEAIGRLMLPAARVERWLVDTGYAGSRIVDLDTFEDWSEAPTAEILRLEVLAESLMAQRVSPDEYPEAFRAAVADRSSGVVGAKSIVAYRSGFDIDWSVPSDEEVVAAIRGWAARIPSEAPRITSPRLLAFGVHTAAQAGLPIQLHVGFGDRDLDLHRVDPMLLLPLLREPTVQRVPVLLLHCYPFQRQAGYLAQAFDNVYFDSGLAINYVGARAAEIIAETLELAPFAKQLYSSDAFGPPELHLLGSVLWRRGMARVLGRWIREGDWTTQDAVRVVQMIGAENARRVYHL